MAAIHDSTELYRNPPTKIGQGGKYDPTRDADGYEWSPKHAAAIVDFFPTYLMLTSGKTAGQKFQLQPWQADYLATLNGWRDASGRRRYRESTFFTPRKNGKTETGAGIALYMLALDGEQKAEVYSAAKDREQASRVFEPAAAMVEKSPSLRSRFRITPSRKTIDYHATHSYYKATSADSGGKHGLSPHCVLFDELHTQPNRSLYEAFKSGLGFRAHPLFVSMSTAGTDRLSICYEVWQIARKVRDGVFRDPEFLPLVYEFPDGADWKDEDVWRDCNPNLGVVTSLEFLRAEFRRAMESPLHENTFRNLYLNEWTEQAVRWIPMEDWRACDVELPNLDGEPCWCGLDMSSTRDVTAFVMAFPLCDGRVALLPHFWIPEDTAAMAERSDRVPYRLWAKNGLVTLTPGRQVDHDKVRADINAFGNRYNIIEIAADRWNAVQILTQLTGDGFSVVQHGQGYASMSGPSKEFEKLVIGHKLIHGGNPILEDHAENVSVERDAAENIKPTKSNSTGRIDGIVAAIMACGRALTSNAGATASYYDTHSVEIS